jgi:SAM-dependent methyltransferase
MKNVVYNAKTLSYEEYYQHLSQHFSSHYGKILGDFEELLHFIKDYMPKNSLVIDVGCGLGYLSRLVSEKFSCDIIGTDVNPYMVLFAKNKSNINEVIRSTVHNLPFKNGCYDAVLFIEVLEHLKKSLMALKEIYRVLEDGGILILTTPNGWILYKKLRKLIKGSDKIDPTHVQEYSWLELKKLVEKSGFRIRKARGGSIFGISLLFPKVGRKITRLTNRFGPSLMTARRIWIVAERTR